jgi:anti-sigma factor RsiW
MMLGLQRLRCRRVRKALWDYAAERLSEGSLEMVERHMTTCAACRREAKAMRQAQGLIAAYRQESLPTPRSDWQALRARLETTTQVAPHQMEGRPIYRHPTSRHFERLMASQSNRWAHSLGRSGAFAALLLLAALGYRNLRLIILAAGSKPQVAATQFKPAPPQTEEAKAPSDAAYQTPSATDRENAADNWPGGFPVVVINTSPVDSHNEMAAVGAPQPGRVASKHTAVTTDAATTQSRSPFALPHHRFLPFKAAIASRRDKTPQFRHYTPRPQDALPPSGTPDNGYVVDSVVPVDNRHSVLQPVPSDHDAPY